MRSSVIAVCRAATLVTVGVFAVACTQDQGRPADESNKAKLLVETERVTALEGQVADLKMQLVRLEASTKIDRLRYASGTFDPTESTYQRIDSPSGFGSFAVSVQDVRPLGDGVRVKLNLGNLSSAAFAAVKLKIEYGPRMPKADDPSPDVSEKWDEWLGAMQTKQVTLTNLIQPGSWNPVDVTLPNVAADKFGYLNISLETDTIHLGRN